MEMGIDMEMGIRMRMGMERADADPPREVGWGVRGASGSPSSAAPRGSHHDPHRAARSTCARAPALGRGADRGARRRAFRRHRRDYRRDGRADGPEAPEGARRLEGVGGARWRGAPPLASFGVLVCGAHGRGYASLGANRPAPRRRKHARRQRGGRRRGARTRRQPNEWS